MRKILALLLALVLLTACLAGCGQKTEPAETPPASAQTDIPSTPRETEPEPASEPEPEPEAEPEPEEEAEPEPEPEPEEPVRSHVEGNPGDFLRVGDEIFFRLYDAEKLEPQAWPDLLNSWQESNWKVGLWAYNETDGSLRYVCDVDGYGDITYGGDGFLSSDYGREDSPYSDVQLFSAEGGLLMTYESCALSQVSPDGRYMAIWCYDSEEEKTLTRIYEGAEELYTLNADYDFAGICGFGPAGETVFLSVSYDYELWSYFPTIWQQTADGTVTELGTIPAEEGMGYPGIEQFMMDEESGRFYLVLSSYTGRASNPIYRTIRGTLGVENSVEVVRTYGSDEEAVPCPGFFCSEDGVGLTRRVPNTVYLSDGDTGDLMYVDAEGGEYLLLKDFITPEEGFGFIIQASAFLDGAAYLIVADVQRSWDGYRGMELTYEPLELYYLRIPADAPHVETLNGTRWTGVTAAEYVEEPDPFDDEYVGLWYLYADDVDGEQVPVEDWYESYISIDYDGWADFVSGGYQQDFSRWEFDVTQDGESGYRFTDLSTEDFLFASLLDPVTMKVTFVHREDGEIISVHTGYYAYEPTEGAPTSFWNWDDPILGRWDIFASETEGSRDDITDIESYVVLYEDGTVDYCYDTYDRYFPYVEVIEGGSYDGSDAWLFTADDTEDMLYVFMDEEGVLGASLLFHTETDSWSWTGLYHHTEYGVG